MFKPLIRRDLSASLQSYDRESALPSSVGPSSHTHSGSHSQNGDRLMLSVDSTLHPQHPVHTITSSNVSLDTATSAAAASARPRQRHHHHHSSRHARNGNDGSVQPYRSHPSTPETSPPSSAATTPGSSRENSPSSSRRNSLALEAPDSRNGASTSATTLGLSSVNLHDYAAATATATAVATSSPLLPNSTSASLGQRRPLPADSNVPTPLSDHTKLSRRRSQDGVATALSSHADGGAPPSFDDVRHPYGDFEMDFVDIPAQASSFADKVFDMADDDYGHIGF